MSERQLIAIMHDALGHIKRSARNLKPLALDILHHDSVKGLVHYVNTTIYYWLVDSEYIEDRVVIKLLNSILYCGAKECRDILQDAYKTATCIDAGLPVFSSCMMDVAHSQLYSKKVIGSDKLYVTRNFETWPGPWSILDGRSWKIQIPNYDIDGSWEGPALRHLGYGLWAQRNVIGKMQSLSPYVYIPVKKTLDEHQRLLIRQRIIIALARGCTVVVDCDLTGPVATGKLGIARSCIAGKKTLENSLPKLELHI